MITRLVVAQGPSLLRKRVHVPRVTACALTTWWRSCESRCLTETWQEEAWLPVGCCDRSSDRARVLEANTHGGWHCVRPEEREQMVAAIQQLNARLQQQETAVTILTSERESLARQVQSLSATTGTPGQRVRVGVVDTWVIGKPDQFDGDR